MLHSGQVGNFGSERGTTGKACGSRAIPSPSPLIPSGSRRPVAPGAVQVAGGQLIVLGVACGTMGGYPHVAHVISADLDRLGQLKAGDVIQFECVTIEEARRCFWRLANNGRR